MVSGSVLHLDRSLKPPRELYHRQRLDPPFPGLWFNLSGVGLGLRSFLKIPEGFQCTPAPESRT